MMDKNELEVYKQAVKEKYKYYRLWKVLAIIFMCLSVLFGVLYFATGDVFKETINDNDVSIENNGDGSNTNNVTINN